MNIRTILDMMKKKSKVNQISSPAFILAVSKITIICDEEYSNLAFYGHAALNRKILLDPRIATLLTPDLLKWLFTGSSLLSIPMKRDSVTIDLRDVIYYGFEHGIYIISLTPNNDVNFSLEKYILQKKLGKNVLYIAQNILIASGVPNTLKMMENIISTEVTNVDNKSLINRFDRIYKMISYLKQNNKSDELLKISSDTPKAIREQTQCGLDKLLKIVTAQKKFDDSYMAFIDNMIRIPEVFLDEDTGHYFWDRVHLEAVLEQDFKINIAKTFYSISDMIRQCIQRLSHGAEQKSIALEQLNVRLYLVEKDLETRFPRIYHEQFTPEIKPLPTPDLHLIPEVLQHNKLKPIEKDQIYELFKGLLKEGVLLYDGSENAIKQSIYQFMIAKENALQSALPYGPNEVNYATKHLQKVLQEVCAFIIDDLTILSSKIKQIRGSFYTLNDKLYHLNNWLSEVKFEEIVLTKIELNVLKKLHFHFHSKSPLRLNTINLDMHLSFTIGSSSVSIEEDISTFIAVFTLKDYTGDNYNNWQNFLRKPSMTKNPYKILYNILALVVTSRFLQQIPPHLAKKGYSNPLLKDTKESCIRIEKLGFGKEQKKMFKVLQQRIKIYQQNKVDRVSAFTSSTSSFPGLIHFLPNEWGPENKIVTIIVQDVDNPTGRAIDTVKYSKEDEKLFPPGILLQYIYYTQQNTTHYFFAKVINPLQDEVYTEKMELKTQIQWQKNIETAIRQTLDAKKEEKLPAILNRPCLLTCTSKDVDGNNLLHDIANKQKLPQDYFHFFTKDCFFRELITENVWMDTPLNFFLDRWLSNIEPFVITEKAIKTMEWLKTQLANIPIAQQTDYNNYFKDLLFSYVRNQCVKGVEMMMGIKFHFPISTTTPLHQTILFIREKSTSALEQIFLMLLTNYPSWAMHGDEKNILPSQLAQDMPHLQQALHYFEAQKQYEGQKCMIKSSTFSVSSFSILENFHKRKSSEVVLDQERKKIVRKI